MKPIALSATRIARLLATCSKPASASRACSRIYELARTRDELERRALLALSTALNEHRHAILASWWDRPDAASEHTQNRDEQVRWALDDMSVARRGAL